MIEYCQSVTTEDFVTKTERLSKLRQGKRVYLNDVHSRRMMKALDQRFETYVKIPRIKHGQQQTLDSLVSEEACLLAKYLRDERPSWHPRIV